MFCDLKHFQDFVDEKIEHLNLILRLSWFYLVNDFISVRLFQIIIEDINIEKLVKNIIDSKFVFCKKHNFILYSKSIIGLKDPKVEEKLNASDTSSNFDEFDDFSKVNDFEKKNF